MNRPFLYLSWGLVLAGGVMMAGVAHFTVYNFLAVSAIYFAGVFMGLAKDQTK